MVFEGQKKPTGIQKKRKKDIKRKGIKKKDNSIRGKIQNLCKDKNII